MPRTSAVDDDSDGDASVAFAIDVERTRLVEDGVYYGTSIVDGNDDDDDDDDDDECDDSFHSAIVQLRQHSQVCQFVSQCLKINHSIHVVAVLYVWFLFFKALVRSSIARVGSALLHGPGQLHYVRK